MTKILNLFEGYGVELEYMIVDRDTLKVKPIADELLKKIAGNYVSDVEFDDIAWSNELVLHVIELKTNGPADSLKNLDLKFFESVSKINNILKDFNSMLLPTGAHPFMDPFTESKLWNHDYNQVYEAYNRIFDCRGHGWSNLQSTHINLPFGNDEEFGKLHAAIRILLPIIPALSASTPILESKLTGFIDTRLEVYRSNQKKIPSIAGKVIPERAFTKKDYENIIFKKIYADIDKYDVDNILKYEWLNSRGTIARFDRNTFEIRIVDIQECPSADLAITESITETIRNLISGSWSSTEDQMFWDEDRLSDIFLKTIKEGEEYVIQDANYLKLFGCNDKCTANELWKHLLKNVRFSSAELKNAVDVIISKGTLSNRILNSMNNDYTYGNIINVYKKLAVCLNTNSMFVNE